MTPAEPLTCAEVDDLAAGFVLGALAAPEGDAVRAHVATCARSHALLAELGGVVPYLALDAAPIEPADSVRARILAGISAETALRRGVPAGVAREGRAAKPRLGGRLRLSIGLAAAGLLVALAGTSAFLAVQLGEARTYADTVARAAALAAEPGSRAISIRAAGGTGPSGTAVVTGTAGGLVVMDGLTSLGGGQVYEVWLIRGTAAPAPAGELRVSGDGHGWLDGLASAPGGTITIALTREPAPGATTPTLPIIASGSSG